MKNDLQSKMNEFDKKEEALKQKKDTELHKIKNEFEQKVKVSSFVHLVLIIDSDSSL